ncbi:hypothetical protein KI387_002208, partial [Taxus chinensis]
KTSLGQENCENWLSPSPHEAVGTFGTSGRESAERPPGSLQGKGTSGPSGRVGCGKP